MEFALVCVVSCAAAVATLFSGFGLGTLLLPAFALFFPVEVAVGATAVVHLANNVFKAGLIGRWADWRVVARFAPAAAVGALLGAWLLTGLARGEPLFSYSIGARRFDGEVVKLVVAAVMLLAVAFEVIPRLERLSFDRRWLVAGGAASGFLGGLSGHQGALRMLFLRRWGLSKEALLGAVAVCAIAVDVARLLVYGWAGATKGGASLRISDWALIGAATASALAGSLLGARLVKKVTMRAVRAAFAAMLVLTAGLLAAGLI